MPYACIPWAQQQDVRRSERTHVQQHNPNTATTAHIHPVGCAGDLRRLAACRAEQLGQLHSLVMSSTRDAMMNVSKSATMGLKQESCCLWPISNSYQPQQHLQHPITSTMITQNNHGSALWTCIQPVHAPLCFTNDITANTGAVRGTFVVDAALHIRVAYPGICAAQNPPRLATCLLYHPVGCKRTITTPPPNNTVCTSQQLQQQVHAHVLNVPHTSCTVQQAALPSNAYPNSGNTPPQSCNRWTLFRACAGHVCTLAASSLGRARFAAQREVQREVHALTGNGSSFATLTTALPSLAPPIICTSAQHSTSLTSQC